MELDIAASVLRATADAAEEDFKELRRKDEENRMKGDITNIPPCILNCLYDRFLINGCAYNNYFCFCAQMTRSLLEIPVLDCMKKCPYNEEVIYAKIAITEFCEIHGDGDTEFLFPWFLIQHESNKRTPTSGVAPPAPAPTVYETVTSTLPWGFTAYTITQDVSDGTATVVYYAQDTQVLTTFFVTTTIPVGAVPYTSIFTDKKSAAITEVIGVTAASTPQGTPISPVSSVSSALSTSLSPTTLSLGSASSPSISPSNPASTNSSNGLSSGAKIGIGVAIPLVFIGLSIIVILFFLRRRKVGRQTEQSERHDGGLQEPTSTINILKESGDHPPSYQSPQVEVSGAAIAEMHQDQQPLVMVGKPEPTSHELNADEQKPQLDGNPVPPSHELSSDQQRYEAGGSPVYTGHEKSTQPQTSSLDSTSPVQARDPASAPGSSLFPPPWDASDATEYEKELNIGPAEAAAAEDQELKELEEEVARVKMQKQRLQEMQALEAREEELRRSIVERKKIGKKP